MIYFAVFVDTVCFLFIDCMLCTNRLVGVWWPASLDFDLELLLLLCIVGMVIGNIQGVMLNCSEWLETPINWLLNMMLWLWISWYGW